MPATGQRRASTWQVVAGVTAALVLVSAVAWALARDSDDDPKTLPILPTVPTLAASAPPAPVRLVWWHNVDVGPVAAYWKEVAWEFEETHPHVTVEILGIPPENIRQRLAVALASGRAPDLFPQWGGGELARQVDDDLLLDLTDEVGAELQAMGASGGIWQYHGRTYGLPYSVGVEGFWYRRSLFAQAGIGSVPRTVPELNDAVVKLRAAGITPIVVGGQDRWQAQHYWGEFALRTCPVSVLRRAADERLFTDPCFEQAAEEFASFVDSRPFQSNFTAAPTFGGPTSSTDIFTRAGAAMELAGHWEPGLVEAFGGEPEDLGWFPFPAVPGGGGEPSAAIGGGDGFSCHADAPPECVELLRFIVSPEVQRRYAETRDGLPVTADAVSSIDDPIMADLVAAREAAVYIATWPDAAYGPVIGQALDDAAYAIFTGQGSAQDLVEALRAAAAAEPVRARSV